MGEKSNGSQCFDLKEAALSLQSSGPSKWSAKQQYQRHNYQKHKSTGSIPAPQNLKF